MPKDTPAPILKDPNAISSRSYAIGELDDIRWVWQIYTKLTWSHLHVGG